MAEETIQSLRYKPQDPRTFDIKNTSPYTVKSMIYPEDLLSGEALYGGNYVIFYINVHEDSKFIKNEDTTFLTDEQMKNVSRVRGDIRAQNVKKSTSIGVASTQGSLTGYAVAGFSAGGGVAGGAFAGGAQTLAGEVLAKDSSSLTRKYKRMKEVIALHMPTDLSVKYGMQWAEEDTLLTASMYAVGEAGIKAFQDATTAVGEDTANATKIAENAVKSLAKGSKSAIVANILKTPGFGDYTSIVTGVATNPKMEQMFKGVDYRTFTFTYRFYPRSSTEADKVQNIIKSFKYHMHPEFKDDQSFLYIYPSEFDIIYYNNGSENMNLHRHTSCVLVDMNIVYGNQGSFIALELGRPAEITMNLTFRELALLNKEHIADGY